MCLVDVFQLSESLLIMEHGEASEVTHAAVTDQQSWENSQPVKISQIVERQIFLRVNTTIILQQIDS